MPGISWAWLLREKRCSTSANRRKSCAYGRCGCTRNSFLKRLCQDNICQRGFHPSEIPPNRTLFCHSTIFLYWNIQVTILVSSLFWFEKTIVFNDWKCVIAISIAEFRGYLLSNPLIWRNATLPRFVSEYSCSFVTHFYPQKFCSGYFTNIV